MKMRDVFEFPVCVPVSTDDELVDDFCGYIAEFASSGTAKAAAHAINMHDDLVELIIAAFPLLKSNAIENPECYLSQNVCNKARELLTREKVSYE